MGGRINFRKTFRGSRRTPGGGRGKRALSYSFSICHVYYSAMQPRVRLQHQPPDWIPSESDFFITACATPRGQNHFCNPTIGPVVLESILNRHDRRIWFCHIAVLMPDHVHLLVRCPGDKDLSRVISEWKSWLGRFHGIPWQRNFFDHRIRNGDSDKDKALYIFHNPLRAGLVKNPEDWPYTWTPRSA